MGWRASVLRAVLRTTTRVEWARTVAEQFAAAAVSGGIASREVEALSIDVYENQMQAYDPSLGLYDWETRAYRHLPASPASVFIPGAGRGREVLGLVEAGYDVWAAEPTRDGVRVLRSLIGERAQQASYEDLVKDPSKIPACDAVVIGWGSLSHVLDSQRRAAVLLALASSTRGPLILSLFTGTAGTKPWRLAARLFGAPPNRGFVPHAGYFEVPEEHELNEVAASLGRTLVTLRANHPAVYLLSAPEPS